MDKTVLCIQQFGEAARLHLDEAILLGEMCLLPNFCHEPDTYEVISAFVNNINNQNLYWEKGGYGEMAVFAKPINSRYDKDRIRTVDIANLFEFGKHLYREIQHDSLGKYWDELDIYRHSELLNQKQFEEWMGNFRYMDFEIALADVYNKVQFE